MAPLRKAGEMRGVPSPVVGEPTGAWRSLEKLEWTSPFEMTSQDYLPGLSPTWSNEIKIE